MKKLRPSTQRGQALVMIALAAIGLFAFAALAIDGSAVFSDRRHAQNAADTAALAAALAKVRGNDYTTAALDRAASNGYVTDADSSVDVHLCSDAGLNPACEGLPGGANPSEYIQVKIVSTIPTTLARIIGRTQVTSVLTAVAHASGGVPTPLLNGAALASLKPTGSSTFGGNGNIMLDVIHSGTFNNSNDNCGMDLVGNGQYHVDTSFQVANGNQKYCQSGNPLMDGQVQNASQVPYPPTIIVPEPSFSCSGNPGAPAYDSATNTYTFSPGNYSSGITLNSTGNINFNPGNYCFGAGVSIGGTADVFANSVNFSITGGDFHLA